MRAPAPSAFGFAGVLAVLIGAGLDSGLLILAGVVMLVIALIMALR